LRESESERASGREREREGLALPVFSRPFVVRNPFSSRPSPLPPVLLDIPFYRHKEMAQLYNGGVAMCYMVSGEVLGRYARVNMSVGGVHEPCRSTAVGAAWILLTSP
jgi:hypothetical protein